MSTEFGSYGAQGGQPEAPGAQTPSGAETPLGGVSNTSSTGGLLTPSASPFLEDGALDDFIQAYIVAITGLTPSLVRPAYQPEPATQPAYGSNWVAFWVQEEEGDQHVEMVHQGSVGGAGQDVLQTHETLEIKTYFYGPNSRSNAKLLRDGLRVPQNQAYWTAQSMGLLNVGSVIRAPTLLKDRWQDRTDFTFQLRRQVTRTYSVFNVNSATAEIITDDGYTVSVPVT